MECGNLKISIGCGRLRDAGFIGVDITQYIDGKGNECVDIVRDIEKHGLPFCDNSAIEIKADNILEHIGDLEFVLNECWRVLKPDGVLYGTVPTAGSNGSFRDPTHKRFFLVDTFEYFCGVSEANPELPKKPKYARYGFMPWNKIEVIRPDDNGSIKFKLSPRK